MAVKAPAVVASTQLIFSEKAETPFRSISMSLRDSVKESPGTLSQRYRTIPNTSRGSSH